MAVCNEKAMTRRFLFWPLLALSACATTEPAVSVAGTIEMAAYLTAKRSVIAQPSARDDFQLTLDTLNVMLSDWTPQPLTQQDTAQALSWMKVPELRCSTGALIIGLDAVTYEGVHGKSRRLKDSELPMVASQVAAGLTRFLEIQ